MTDQLKNPSPELVELAREIRDRWLARDPELRATLNGESE